MFSNASQTIATAFGTVDQITMDGRMQNYGLSIDNSRIIVNNSGVYEISFSINPIATFSFLTTFMIRVNGTSVYSTAHDVGITGDNNIIVSTLIRLEAGDILDLAASASVIGIITIPSGNIHIMLKQLS